jgi:hypothetical protein
MQCVKSLPFLTTEESNIIAERVLALEDKVKQLGPDIYGATKDNSLTGRYYCFNFLTDETIGSIMIPKLRNIFGPCIVQCWANIFREGEGINEHKHIQKSCQDPEFIAVANLFLRGDPTIGTYYEGVKRDNKIGEITVFPTDMKHYVPKNPTKSVRISMAMDLYVDNEKVAEYIRNDTRRFVHIN